MSKKHRYTVEVDFYIWADSDVEAILKANEFAKEQDMKEDNQCVVRSVSSSPFASLISNTIYSNN